MRPVIVYAALLVAMLVAAYLQWTAAPGADAEDQVVLVAGEPEDVVSIAWKGEDAEVLLTRKEDAHGGYLWVEHTKWEEQKLEGPELPLAEDPADPAAEDAADPTAADATAADVTAALPTERVARRTVFKASGKGDELVGKLAPLLAIRKLDGVAADKLAEIGLDAPTETLVLTRKGGTTTLQIGGEAYGTKDRYVRDVDSGAVYLLDDQLLKDLEYARTRLPDRSLWSFETPAIATVTIQHGERSRTVQQKNPDDPQAATWTAVGAEAEDAQVKTWMDKALKLKGTSTVDPAAEDAPKDLQERFRLTLTPASKDGRPETVVVLQDGAEGDWYAQSEHTRGLLKLLRAPTRAVADDVAALVAEP